MSYTGGVTSAAHTLTDIDKTIEAFDSSIEELTGTGKIEQL